VIAISARDTMPSMPAQLPLPDPPLTDDALALRPWGPEDLPNLLAAAADPVVHRYRYSLPVGADEARAWLAAVEHDRLSGERIELAITTADAPEAVGSIALWGFHRRNRAAMVSYWLAPGGRGRGRATRAVRLMAGWAFDVLGQQRLALQVEVQNLASQHVAERCGFHREGQLRSHQQLRDGTRANVFVYGLLAGELSPTRR
jgi:RimJ/RimL family protein N-acetyltransferase